MKTYTIKNQSDLKELLDEDKNLIVDGHLELRIGISIRGSIKAGGWIEAGGLIEAGGSIKAGGWIEAGRSIKAGGWIEAGGSILSLHYKIICTQIITKTLPYWREFYAAFVDEESAAIVRDENECWNSIREKLKPKAKELSELPCWHPIIRAQIRMFFGLSKSEKL